MTALNASSQTHSFSFEAIYINELYLLGYPSLAPNGCARDFLRIKTRVDEGINPTSYVARLKVQY